jgi:hypothetical protein
MIRLCLLCFQIIEECNSRCSDEQLATIRDIVTSTYAPYKK